MVLINYYIYTDKSNTDKQKLADILQGLKNDQPELVVNLNEMVKIGNFERLSRFILPYTMYHIAQFDNVKWTAALIRQPELGLDADNAGDFREYLKNTKGLHIADDMTARQTNGTELFTDLLHIDDPEKPAAVHFKNAGKTYLDEVEPPISDTQWLRERSPVELPKSALVRHYVVSRKESAVLAKRFKREVMAALPKAVFPKNEALETGIMQMFLTVYRQTIIKDSPNGRPVVYTPTVESIMSVLRWLTDDANVIEQWDQGFTWVDGHKLLDTVMHESDTVNGRPATIPISDENQETLRYTWGFNNVDPKADNQVLSVHEIDAFVGTAPVLDGRGHVMHEAPVADLAAKRQNKQ